MSWNNYSAMNQLPTAIVGQQNGGAPTADAGGVSGGGIGGGIDDALYGTLDLGHQTQINDDLVRTIREEIIGIDKSLQITSTSVKAMEQSYRQLTKDHNHSRGEMAKYRRDAAEVLDSEMMDEEVRGGFKEQFELIVAPHVVVSPENHTSAVVNDRDDGDDDVVVVPNRHATENNGSSGDDDDGNDSDGNNNKTKQQQQQPRIFSHKKFIGRKQTEAATKKSSIISIQNEIKSTRKKIKSCEATTANLLHDMEVRQLDKVRAEGERKVGERLKELEKERQRNRGVREAVQVARANSGRYAQGITEKSKEQMEERSKNLEREHQLKSHYDARKEEVALLESEEKELDRELATLSGQLDFLTKQSTEFESEQKKSVDMKVEAENVQRDIVELMTKKEGKTKEVEVSNADLQAAILAFEQASKAVADANAEKLANDKASAEVLDPAVTRKANAIKEKERLAGEVVELQTSIEQAQASNKDIVATSESKVTAKTNEVKELMEKLQKARGDLEQLQKDGAARQEALVGQLNELKEHTAKFEAATTSEISKLDMLKKERIEARKAHLDKRRADFDIEKDSQRSDVENLKQLYTFLQEQQAYKEKIETHPIELDKHGDELDPIGKEGGDEEDLDDLANEDGSPALKRGRD